MTRWDLQSGGCGDAGATGGLLGFSGGPDSYIRYTDVWPNSSNPDVAPWETFQQRTICPASGDTGYIVYRLKILRPELLVGQNLIVDASVTLTIINANAANYYSMRFAVNVMNPANMNIPSWQGQGTATQVDGKRLINYCDKVTPCPLISTTTNSMNIWELIPNEQLIKNYYIDLVVASYEGLQVPGMQFTNEGDFSPKGTSVLQATFRSSL